MIKIQKIFGLVIVFCLFSISTTSASSPTGYIECSTRTENSIRLNYDFRGGNNVSLFRDNTRINTWDSSDEKDLEVIKRDIDDLKRKIEYIAKEIEEILKGDDAVATFTRIPPGFRFTRELGYGSVGEDVRYMEIIFNADPQTRIAVSGVSSPGQESDMFGNMTKNAVRRFQAKYAAEILHPWNTTVPTGYAGMQTIKKLNKILEGSTTIIRIPPTDAVLLTSMLLDIRKEINDLKRRIDDLNYTNGSASGIFTDTGLSPNTTYTYYLRDGRTTTSPRIDTVTCRTDVATVDPDPDPDQSTLGFVNCSANTANSIGLSYSFSNGNNVSLFRGSTRINSWASSASSGVFTDTNLSPNTSYTYYLRNGISSTSPQIGTITCKTNIAGPTPFSCGDTLTDSRDNIKYKTVQIGNQCWFAEDLRHNNGCLTTTINYANLRSGNNCMKQTSGYSALLYQWRTVMSGSTQERARGLCPEGWHIPSDGEWRTLETTLGMSQSDSNNMEWNRTSGSVGVKLKTTGWGGSNSSGFSALPGGHYNRVGESLNPGNYGYWWTSTSSSSTGAYHRTIRRDSSAVGRFTSHYDGASSIRCIKD